MTRAAGYVRISREDDTTTSPARQRTELQRLADSNGWTLDLYEDIDRSAYATRQDRPSFDRMVSRLDGYDILACWKLDRLVRRSRDLATLVEQVDAADVQLVSVTEGTLGGGPGGNFVLTIFGGLAELESATISMRVRSAQAYMIQHGRFRGGRRPYGYQTVPAPDGGWLLEPDPAETAVVAEAASRIVGGESIRSVAWDLNARGLLTQTGARWASRTLGRMLRSPALLGQQPTKGDVVRDDDGLPLKVRAPVLDDITWRRLQAELDARASRRVPPRRRDSTLLGGLVRCAVVRHDGTVCGATMVGWNSDNPQASYACDTRAQQGPDWCTGNSINRAKLDELVEGLLLLVDPADVAAERARRQAADERPDPTAARVAQLEQALTTLERDRQELGLYDGPDGERRYVDRWRKVTAELESLHRRRAQTSRPALPDVAVSGDLASAWPGYDRAERRRTILATVRRINVQQRTGKKRWDPTRVSVEWVWSPPEQT